MEVIPLSIPGTFEIIPRIFKDDRGTFFESFRMDILAENGVEVTFVQDNQSFSRKNVLRGIHFQVSPQEQGKLVGVVSGSVLDVAVDLRSGSKFFGEHIARVLDDRKKNMLYIPEGFGHGFLSLEDCILQYKCTNYYHAPSDTGIVWNDPDLKIDWGIKDPILSEKDANLPSFQSFKQNIV